MDGDRRAVAGVARMLSRGAGHDDANLERAAGEGEPLGTHGEESSVMADDIKSDPRKKLLPGQYTMSDALTMSIESLNKACDELWDEIERARAADWKTPDGQDWKFD
jgi:hypothetical protein